MTPTEAADRCYALVAENRLEEALRVIEPYSNRPDAQHAALAAHGLVLKGLGRLEDAIPVYQRAVEIAPMSAVAEHNLAGALGDFGRYAEAEAGARRAFAKGLDAPETWLTLARALQGQHRLEESEAAYREVLKRRPADPTAHRNLAQLIWMRDEDAEAAVFELDAAIAAHPREPALAMVKAKALEYAGDTPGSYEALMDGLSRAPDDVGLLGVAARIAVAVGEPLAGLRHAERALALKPEDVVVLNALAQAALAVGDARRAATVAEGLHRRDPLDQMTIALMATAWRLLGDPRAAELYDYDSFVRPSLIATPTGWDDLAAYLRDLGTALHGLHRMRAHPFDQSLRHGSQVDLQGVEDPAIRALPEAFGPSIAAYLMALGRGEGPLRGRNTGACKFQGIWSVRLRSQGFHTGHVHPRGWISSACYVDLPDAVADETRMEGWIKFGEPGVPTRPPLPAERFLRPEPGMLVLFPSYMWHGTTPFAADRRRLSVAFDLLPA